jgi:hypothetical protein
MEKIFKLIAMNTFVFIGMLSIINACAILFFKIDYKIKSLSNSNIDPRSSLPNYSGLSWAADYFQEFNNLPTEYRSYVGWRRLAYNGKTIKIDSNGIRFTPPAVVCS